MTDSYTNKAPIYTT